MTVVGLSLARLCRQALVDRATLTAMGCTSGQLTVAATAAVVPALVLGVGGGVAAGVVGSRLAVTALARSVDPRPGAVIADASIALGATAAAVIVALVLAVLAARRAALPSTRTARPATSLVPLGRPVAVSLGVRDALFGTAAGARRTSRGAIVVAAVGVALAVAALTISASIGRLQSDPTLSGQGSSRVIDSGESTETMDRALPRLEADPQVAMLAAVHVSFDISADGLGDMSTLAFDVRRGDIQPSVIEGAIPQGPDDVAMGPVSLERLHKHVGDTVTLSGPDGDEQYRIVGSMLFPEGDFDHDDGIALTIAGADRLLGDTHDAAQLHQVAFNWADDVDAARADQDLADDGLPVLTQANALRPATVTNLGQVEVLPRFLALFVGLLAIAALAHALAASFPLRARQLATLRALGVTRRTTVGVVAAHAATIATVAVLGGLPAGLVLGKQLWTPIATGANVVVRPVASWSWISLLLIAGLAGSALVALVPLLRTWRLQPHDQLRTE
jgi:ABC-type lipoprotein release transport system permease subunit